MLQRTQVFNTGAANNDGYPTTRRYPRTLDEAFSGTASYANPITHYKKTMSGACVRLVAYGVFYGWLCVAVYMAAKQYEII